MKSAKLFLVLMLIACAGFVRAEKVSINISAKAGYYDENVVAVNIKNECTKLGTQLSDSTKKYMKKHGYVAIQKPDINQADAGKNLIIQIVNAYSGGSAWTGHKKSVTAKAELYQDGKLVDTFEASRGSGGGFGGGFKGACSVLHRCVNTLGNDIAKWIKRKKIK